MLPPNTVPITTEEFTQLENGTPFYYLQFKNRDYEKWELCWRLPVNDNHNTPCCILEHDYRHYFGEVVDLKDYVNNEYVTYCGFSYRLKAHSENTFVVRDWFLDDSLFQGSETECKEWILKQITPLITKDLPQYNLKFIFS